MKLCNVCGKELRRKHPACNRKAVKDGRIRVAGTSRITSKIMSANLKDLKAAVTRAGITISQELGPVHYGDRSSRSRPPASESVRAPLREPTMAEGIAAMGQPNRDAILRRLRKEKE